MCVCVTVWNRVSAFVCLSLLAVTEQCAKSKEVNQSRVQQQQQWQELCGAHLQLSSGQIANIVIHLVLI